MIYQAAAPAFTSIAAGVYPWLHVLIVSGFYGLARLDEGLKLYELELADTLCYCLVARTGWHSDVFLIP